MKTPIRAKKKTVTKQTRVPKQATSPRAKKVLNRPAKKKAPLPRLRKSPLPIFPSNHPFTLPSFLPKPKEPSIPHFEFLGDLPESYGTRRLFLTPRDPQTLFAYWDFTREQLEQAEKEAS